MKSENNILDFAGDTLISDLAFGNNLGIEWFAGSSIKEVGGVLVMDTPFDLNIIGNTYASMYTTGDLALTGQNLVNIVSSNNIELFAPGFEWASGSSLLDISGDINLNVIGSLNITVPGFSNISSVDGVGFTHPVNGDLFTVAGNGTVYFHKLTASTVPYLDSSKVLISSSVTPTELGYLSGVTSSIQTQLDALLTGLFWKAAVRVATTAAGTLASDFENGDAIDGVTLTTGDRILIKDQSTASENGIYIVNTSGAPTRAADFNAGADNIAGASVTVQEGTINQDTRWTCSTNNPITVGSTSLTFVSIGGTLEVSDASYGGGWDGVTAVAPSKNAVYDAFLPLDGSRLMTSDIQFSYGTKGLLWDSGNTIQDNGIYILINGEIHTTSNIQFDNIKGITWASGSSIKDSGGTISLISANDMTLESATSTDLNLNAGAGLNLNSSNSGDIGLNSSNDVQIQPAIGRKAYIYRGLNLDYGTVSTVPYIDASKNLVSSAVTPTELGYLSGVTSAIQTQLNNRVLHKREFGAPDFDDPNNSNWAINANAELTVDSINAGLLVRRFDDTAEEGIGFDIFVPADAVSFKFTMLWRVQTTPGDTVGIQPSLQVREFIDNATIESWAEVDMTPLSATVAQSTNWQYDTETISLATLGLVAGRKAVFEFTRETGNPNDTLVGDWVLHTLMVEVI